jgi:hypothetical protein
MAPTTILFMKHFSSINQVTEEYREHMEDMKSKQEKEMKDLVTRHRSESTNV